MLPERYRVSPERIALLKGNWEAGPGGLMARRLDWPSAWEKAPRTVKMVERPRATTRIHTRRFMENSWLEKCAIGGECKPGAMQGQGKSGGKGIEREGEATFDRMPPHRETK